MFVPTAGGETARHRNSRFRSISEQPAWRGTLDSSVPAWQAGKRGKHSSTGISHVFPYCSVFRVPSSNDNTRSKGTVGKSGTEIALKSLWSVKRRKRTMPNAIHDIKHTHLNGRYSSASAPVWIHACNCFTSLRAVRSSFLLLPHCVLRRIHLLFAFFSSFRLDGVLLILFPSVLS